MSPMIEEERWKKKSLQRKEIRIKDEQAVLFGYSQFQLLQTATISYYPTISHRIFTLRKEGNGKKARQEFNKKKVGWSRFFSLSND